MFIKSALVKTWIAGVVDSTKYLFPIAPKIAPTLKSILDPKSVFGTVKTTHEIKNAKNDPINSLKKSQDPDLEIIILKVQYC